MLVKLLLVLLGTALLPAADTLRAFGYEWEVPDAAAWKVEAAGGEEVLRQVTNPTKDPVPRRPGHFAVAKTRPFTRVTIDCEIQRVGKSMIVLYAYRDAAHFNYVHLSSDAARAQIVHNGIFHVHGGERVRISKTDGPGTLPTTAWTKVRIVHDGKTGRVWTEVEGQRNPSLDAVDVSLTEGRIGLGSFFETGAFRRVKITGE